MNLGNELDVIVNPQSWVRGAPSERLIFRLLSALSRQQMRHVLLHILKTALSVLPSELPTAASRLVEDFEHEIPVKDYGEDEQFGGQGYIIEAFQVAQQSLKLWNRTELSVGYAFDAIASAVGAVSSFRSYQRSPATWLAFQKMEMHQRVVFKLTNREVMDSFMADIAAAWTTLLSDAKLRSILVEYSKTENDASSSGTPKSDD